MNVSYLVRRGGRWLAVAALLLACWQSNPARAADMSDPLRTCSVPTWWKGSTGLLLTNANDGKVFAYASDVGDTTGTTIWATFTAAFAVWTFSNFKTDLYTVVYTDSVDGETTLATGYPLACDVLGDGQIDRPEAFGDSVIPPSALNPDSTYGFVRLAADSLSANDSTLIAITSPVLCDSAVTIGAYTLPIADGAVGNVLKTDGAGVLSWAADATGVGGSDYSDSLQTLDGRFGADTWLNALGEIDTTTIDVAGFEKFVQDHQSAVPPGAGTIFAVSEGDVELDATVDTLDFLGTDFDLTESPEDEANIAIAAAITRDTEWDTASEINAATTDADFLTAEVGDIEGVTAGEGLTGTATSGTATLAVNLDVWGGLESVDDSLNVKASGVLESMLKCVDAAGDEEFLTFETTTGDFEWQAEVGDISGMTAGDGLTGTVSSGAGTFDVLMDVTGGIETADDSLNIKASGVTEAMLKAVDAAGDEEFLTYETTTGDFEWQAEVGDIEGVTAGDGLHGTATSGTASLSVLVDVHGGIEIVDDSLNVKLDGATLTVSSAGLKVTASTYQPLEATLTDIADGTIVENLVNTDNPWADNEVSDVITVGASGSVNDAAIPAGITRDTEWDTVSEINTATTDADFYYVGGTDVADADVVDALTLSTVSGAVDLGAATSLEVPNDANPTTNAEGEVAWDADDDALEVYSGDESESALIPMYQKIDVTIFAPDEVNDQIPIFHVDALAYPFGIEIDQVSITIPADAAYTMVFEEWAGDPPAAQADIETVTTGAGDSYMEDGTITNDAVDADDYIFLDIPATDVDWIHCQVIFHVKEGD